ncbi:Predicted arabinose efflux permease, MFS family [Paenibacillus catalpae]|uniref:Predicted arabinose efflux permease, MFS family n=1 Tax=Paenibacillus catalpae TaxID=1045775 RepID=A0A1I1VB60_9BACL|nr:MFS transporter [Paenibacillus catalpae]SFD80242.1 Predicted arabinose efflux permease, MFS family [Paenibacillus catalpae]
MKGALSWPFLRLYLLSLLYFSANSILNVLIPLKGDSLGASNTEIGLIMGAYLFTTMLLRPWAGHIIQQKGPVQVLRTIIVINGLALILYTFTGLEGYFFARMLQGACTAFFSMALQLGIIDALPDKERSQGISLYSLFASIPNVIGPLLAVGIWQSGEMTSFAWTMLAIVILTGVAGFSIRIDNPQVSAPGPTEQRVSHFRSFSQLYTNPYLFRCSVIMLIASIVFGAITTFIPLYAAEIPNGSAAVYLTLQAGTIVAARFFLRKRIPSDGKWHAGYVMTIALIVAASSLGVCVSGSVWGGTILFYISACLMGISQALLYPTLTTYLSFVLPQQGRNVLLGLFIAMADLGVSMGGAAMGPLADLTSFSVMYLICAFLGVLMAVFSYDRRGKLSSAATLDS